MAAEAPFPDYGWSQQIPHSEAYLWRSIKSLLNELALKEAQVLDLGCGNGALVAMLDRWGYTPVGVDPSSSGIQIAMHQSPHLMFHQASADQAELASLELPAFEWF